MDEQLKERVSNFPELPGVYLLKDQKNRVIYVGKALSLRQRVRSYLSEAATTSPRLQLLQSKLADVEYVVTDNEVEALILECSLIKEYRPAYNVNLKDDKDYPYLIITAEKYPRLELLRLSQKRGRRGRYRLSSDKSEIMFGPYTNVSAVRETLRFLGSVFPLRRCRQTLDGKPTSKRPCLNYEMNRCIAPCRGSEVVDPEQYNKIVKQVVLFLNGRFRELEYKLKQQMAKAAEDQHFEEAAAIRDRLSALQRVSGQQQKMLSTSKNVDRDVLALAQLDQHSAVHLFQIRDGKLLNQEHFPLTGATGMRSEEIIASFIKSYYSQTPLIPPEILISNQPLESELLAKWLKLRAGRKVILRVPRRGMSDKLVKLALRNCLLRMEDKTKDKTRKIDQPLQRLGSLIGLKKEPQRIECYDISHLQGSESVGSMIVFYQGEPQKESYRHFIIKQAAYGDDYAALQETVARRVSRKDWPVPDMILIDGGKGQLSAVNAVLSKTDFKNIPLAALAKNPDQLFIKGVQHPLVLPEHDSLLHLLQRIRDEAHRFAISHHRKRRSHSSVHSILEDIPGIGSSKRTAILKHFGNIDNIRRASQDELSTVSGISKSLARVIHQKLNNSGN